MESLLIECAARAYLIAAAMALVLFVMRVRRAAIQHAVWASVVMVMLILPFWVALGPKARLPILSPEVAPQPFQVSVAGGHDAIAAKAQTKATTPQPAVWDWSEILFGVYVLGVCLLLLRLAIGSLRINSLLRTTVVRNGRCTHVACAAPITVGWVRPRVILPVDWPLWPQERLDAVLLHEREHMRRRDPLFQWLALLNRALFWFHPLAWWMERRLALLAEEACDEAVLAHGHDPRSYSEYLLDSARAVERAGARVEVLGMAMPGPFLPQRIRRVLSGASPQISRARLACAIFACAVLGVTLAAGTLVRAQPGTGATGQTSPKFEVVSVRPSKASDDFKSKGGGRGGLASALNHGRFTDTDSLYGLVLRAYGIRGCRPQGLGTCPLLSGGPSWLKKDKFDIQAKMPEHSPDYTFSQFLDGRTPELQLMLQALLAERFHLRVHREKKQLPVYALTVGKSGPKIKKAGAVEIVQLPDGSSRENRGVMFHPSDRNGIPMIQLTVKHQTMQQVADTYSTFLGRPVLDRTGLQGEFDFTLEYEPDPDASDLPGAQLVGPALFTAFREQAGLRMESTIGMVDVLVIDHAEQPSEN